MLWIIIKVDGLVFSSKNRLQEISVYKLAPLWLFVTRRDQKQNPRANLLNGLKVRTINHNSRWLGVLLTVYVVRCERDRSNYSNDWLKVYVYNNHRLVFHKKCWDIFVFTIESAHHLLAPVLVFLPGCDLYNVITIVIRNEQFGSVLFGSFILLSILSLDLTRIIMVLPMSWVYFSSPGSTPGHSISIKNQRNCGCNIIPLLSNRQILNWDERKN